MKNLVILMLSSSALAGTEPTNPISNRAPFSFLTPERVGARAGFSMDKDSSEFHQSEVSISYDLPWRTQLGSKFELSAGIDSSAGWLGDGFKDAFIVSAGLEGRLRHVGLPCNFRFGSSPTYLSRFSFDHRDFGIILQFVSYVGVSWDLSEHTKFSYRLQHMSNAGFARPNPGLNMHMFEVMWEF